MINRYQIFSNGNYLKENSLEIRYFERDNSHRRLVFKPIEDID